MASNRPSFPCPECGAALLIRSPASVLVVCEYCRTAAYWNEAAILSAGQQSALAEGFTRLYRGAVGWIEQNAFEVLGRVRYQHRSGIWDEWYISFNRWRTAWVTEDDHQLAIQQLYSGAPPPDAASWRPGFRFTLDGRQFEVDEVGETECVGIEGQLPKHILTGERYRYVDASSLDGRLALGIELDETPPTVFLGRWLQHDEVRLEDEGKIW